MTFILINGSKISIKNNYPNNRPISSIDHTTKFQQNPPHTPTLQHPPKIMIHADK